MIRDLLKVIGWLLLAALGSLVPVATVYLDAVVLRDGVSETGITEILQHLLVLATAVLFLRRATTTPDQRGFLILVGGFFSVAFIREIDGFLDEIHHGFWIYPALAVTLVSCIHAARSRHTILKPMLAFAHSHRGVVVLLGLVVLLVFSRVFGTGALWEAILEDRDTARLVKTAVQEGLELLGYVLVFLGACHPR